MVAAGERGDNGLRPLSDFDLSCAGVLEEKAYDPNCWIGSGATTEELGRHRGNQTRYALSRAEHGDQYLVGGGSCDNRYFPARLLYS